MKKVLVIATSHKTRGGITSVIKAHQKGVQWQEYHCKWIETHIDKGLFYKLYFFIKAWILFMIYLPFYQIVHIHMSEPISALRKFCFFYISKIFKKKIILHFHAFSPETTIHGKFKRLYEYMFAKSDKVIVLSQAWKEYVNESFHLGDKVVVIFNPCITVILKDVYPKKKYILYAGTINARKGYVDMIKAFAEIAYKYPEWKILFAGNGEIQQGEELANKLGIGKQTIFLGWVDGKDKDKIFKESSIFCLPSYAEGFPMAVLDAWAYGLPVITTPVGGIPDIAKDGENVLLFNPGDLKKLAYQMEKLIKNEDLRLHLIKESIKLSQTTFNAQIINRQIESLYESL